MKFNQYIKSHIPALYLLETERFEDEDALIEDLVSYFRSRHDFIEMVKDDRDFEVSVRESATISSKKF